LKEFHPAVLKRMMQLDKQDAKKNMKRTSSSNDSGSERQSIRLEESASWCVVM
jgi:hypothetical protein